MSELPPIGESEGYGACPDEVALPTQIECCERERRLTDSKTGVLVQGNVSSDHLLPHSNSFGFEMEKDAAGYRAFNRNYIVGGYRHENGKSDARGRDVLPRI